MSLSSETAIRPATTTSSATGRPPTTDSSPGYKPEVNAALMRRRDKLVEIIRNDLKECSSRSIQGSLYLLLIAVTMRFTNTLKRLAEFRDLYGLIKGCEIDSVKKFATALPTDVTLDEVIDDDTKSAIELAKMLGKVAQLRSLVAKTDAGNLEFYDRLRGEIEAGKINSFGALCDRLPTFIVDLDDDMRRARNHFRDERDAQRTVIINFQTKANADVKQDISFTTFGTVKNAILRVLRQMIGDFAEPALIPAWQQLRKKCNNNEYTSIGSFLADVPEQLRHKANQLTAAPPMDNK